MAVPLTASGAANPTKMVPRHRSRPILNLNVDYDNDARAAWRRGQQPTDLISLPQGFDPFGWGASQYFERVAADTGTYLLPRKGQGEHSIVIQVWGDGTQCATAKRRLNGYIKEHHRPATSKGKKFDKIHAFVGYEKEEQIEKRLKKEAKRQKYRQAVTDQLIATKKFAFTMILKWGNSKWKLEDVLGPHLEALDPIRMDGLCYITFVPRKDDSCFLLLGNKKEKMQSAVARLQSIDKQVISKQFERHQFFLVKPLPTPLDYSAYRVSQVQYFKPSYRNDVQAITRYDGMVMSLEARGTCNNQSLNEEAESTWSIDCVEPGAVWIGAIHAERLNSQYLDLWLASTLQYFPYFPGHLEMRVRLGTCVFTNYKKPEEGSTYTLGGFEDMLLEKNTQQNELEAFSTAELGDEKVEIQLLDRFFAASDSLIPIDPPDMKMKGGRGRPRYRVVFHLEGPSEASNNLRLEIWFKENGYGQYDRDYCRWFRLSGDELDPGKVMDISLIDLENSITSYNLTFSAFDLLTPTREAKLPKIYHYFAEKVTLIQENAQESGSGKRFINFLTYKNTTSISILHFEQRRIWPFTIRGTGYMAELFTTQIADCAPEPKPRQERWGVQVYHRQWDELMSKNNNLAIGKNAGWEPAEWQLFPPEGRFDHMDMEGMEHEVGSGYRELLRVMGLVQGIVMGNSLVGKKMTTKVGTMETLAESDTIESLASQPAKGKEPGKSAEIDLLSNNEPDLMPNHPPLMPLTPNKTSTKPTTNQPSSSARRRNRRKLRGRASIASSERSPSSVQSSRMARSEYSAGTQKLVAAPPMTPTKQQTRSHKPVLLNLSPKSSSPLTAGLAKKVNSNAATPGSSKQAAQSSPVTVRPQNATAGVWNQVARSPVAVRRQNAVAGPSTQPPRPQLIVRQQHAVAGPSRQSARPPPVVEQPLLSSAKAPVTNKPMTYSAVLAQSPPPQELGGGVGITISKKGKGKAMQGLINLLGEEEA